MITSSSHLINTRGHLLWLLALLPQLVIQAQNQDHLVLGHQSSSTRGGDMAKTRIARIRYPEETTNNAYGQQITLTSMEDLNHLSNLLLRNYNITDEALVQSSWLMGANSVLSTHKQHQFPMGSNHMNSVKANLARGLESFISHLRNGHLRRMRDDDLDALIHALNLTLPLEMFLKRHNVEFTDTTKGDIMMDSTTESGSARAITDINEKRCYRLVTLHKFDLSERQTKSQDLAYQLMSSDNNISGSISSSTEPTNDTNLKYIDGSAPSQTQPNEETNSTLSHLNALHIDESRLLGLCRLVVTCQTADDMVLLISKIWTQRNSEPSWSSIRDDQDGHSDKQAQRLADGRRIKQQAPNVPTLIRYGRMFSEHNNNDNDRADSLMGWSVPNRNSLRDSLSSSLAKLCPIILFQLHEDDERCSARRDDTPPMLAVWGFATLFVTIVSFCSLLGLSITPLIGHSTSVEEPPNVSGSPVKSNGSGSALREPNKLSTDRSSEQNVPNRPQHPSKRHKATLTIFEGLAVGSLVGSALFSLIPQAFELQERESNESFLMKAFIIFSGIYLFFCSERIMKIILDTRQRTKRDKRLNNRSSTTAAIEPMDRSIVASVHSVPCPTHVAEPQDPMSEPRQMHSRKVEILQPVADGCTASSDRLHFEETSHNTSQNHRDEIVSYRKQDEDCTTTIFKTHGSKKKRFKEAEKRRKRRMNRNSDLQHFSSSSSSSSYSLTDSEDEVTGSSNERLDRVYCCSQSSNIYHDNQDNSYTSDSDLDNHIHSVNYREKARFGMLKGTTNGEESSDTDENEPDWLHLDSSIRSSSGLNLERSGDLSSDVHRSKRHVIDSGGYMVAEQRSPKQEISTVAWMIILGDGLHNFIDGISIGAAFSESILSGVSISVAVICEEFPHELGDFAVLVSSGMTVRQALGYNFLSACTCYFGMAVGIILGDVTNGASYISALAAGVFLYIALVDMMGELSAALESSCSHDSLAATLKLFLLQNFGIFIGISIIFVLSFIDF